MDYTVSLKIQFAKT